MSCALILVAVCACYSLEMNSYTAYAKLCGDKNDGNGPLCKSPRQVDRSDDNIHTSAQTNDGTGDSLDSPDGGGSNGDVVSDHHSTNHRGGGQHTSQDDIPFSLPFP